MADAPGIEAAIRRVLPALNFEPTSLDGLTSFVTRARRRIAPSVRALNGVEDVLVYLGIVDAVPEEFATEAGYRGLATLTEATRSACQRLIVAWENRSQRGAAAAFAVDAAGNPGSPLGVSWLPPEDWPSPMVDVAMLPKQRIDAALAGIRAVIAASPHPPDFAERLRRTLNLLDVAIHSLGGEGQDLVPARGPINEPTDWNTWFVDLERSVRDEERRLAGGRREERIGVAEPIAGGALAGLRVFLSYARPDSSTLARPVNRALREAGAQIWFDQEEPLEKTWLDEGLASRIADCDAFVMCASDEYIERAGYATQELAWALARSKGERRLRRFAVAMRPETILPSLVKSWPQVVINGGGPLVLTGRLAAALEIESSIALELAKPRPSTPPPLPVEADLEAARCRRRHIRRFLEITVEDALAFAAGKAEDRRAAETKQRLMALGEGLDWDATLAGIESWPEDPLVRGCRWDLACLRILALLRWPLSGDLSQPDGIAADIERVLTLPIPIFEWPTTCGWADNERRLWLRRQAGLLRVLDEMLKRGLYGGLIAEHVDGSTIDAWTQAVADRRQEIVDALIELRLAGTLSWRGDPPTWDDVYRQLSQFLTSPRDARWHPVVPQEVLMLIGGNAEDIAAVAADVAWMAARQDTPCRQRFLLRNWMRPLEIEIWSRLGLSEASETMDGEGARLAVGLAPSPEGELAVILGWRGLEPAVAAGAAWAPAPETLRQRLRLSSA